jgi:hypothetical protein
LRFQLWVLNWYSRTPRRQLNAEGPGRKRQTRNHLRLRSRW